MSNPVIRTTYTEHNDLFPRGQHPDERSNKQFCIDMGWRKSQTHGKWYPQKPLVYRKRIVCLNNNKEYESLAEAAKELDLDPKLISMQVNGKIKTHKGYMFERL